MQLNIIYILLFSVSSLSRVLMLEILQFLFAIPYSIPILLQFLHSSCGKLLALLVRCLAWGMEAVSGLGLDLPPWCPMQGLAWLCCVQNWSWGLLGNQLNHSSRADSWGVIRSSSTGVLEPRMAFCLFLNPLGFGDATGMCHCLGWGFSSAWLEKTAFSQAFQPGSKQLGMLICTLFFQCLRVNIKKDKCAISP